MKTLFGKSGACLGRLSPNTVFAIGLAYTLTVGLADRLQPGPMSFTLFYVLGSGFVGWGAGRRRAAVVSSVAFILIGTHDFLQPHHPPLAASLVVWNVFTRFVVVGLAGWLSAEISRLTHHLTRLADERTAQWKAETQQHRATSARLAEALERSKQISAVLRPQAWILENMGEAMIASTLEGTVEMTNPAADRLTGYAAAELLGQNITLLSPFPDSETPEQFQKLRKKLEGHSPWLGEIPLRRKDGRVLITQVNLSRLQSGERTLVVALYQDITERKQAEANLRAREERLQLGLEAGRMITWDLDPVSGEISYSESLKSFLGDGTIEPYRTLERYLQQIHPDDLASATQALSAAISQGTPAEHEYRARHPDGTYRWFLTKGRAVHDSKGQPIRLVGVSLDITERKRAEQQLADALDLNRTMVAASPVGIVAYKATGQCVFANAALARMTNGTIEQLLTQNFRNLRSWRDGGIMSLAEEALNEGRATTAEARMVSSFNKEVWMECYFTPFVSGGEAHLLFMAHDISERKRAEQQLADALDLNRTMVATSPVGIAAYKAAGPCVFANEALARITGGSVEELRKQDFRSLQGWQRGGLLSLAKDALNQGCAQSAEIHSVTTFGKEVWVECYMTRFVSGTEEHLLLILHDITERKRAEAALALSQQQLAAAMDLAHLANWEYDFATGMYTFDDRFFALYGTTAAREGGNQMSPETYVREFFFPEDAHLVAQGLEQARLTTDPNLGIQMEHRIRRRDGEVRHLLIRVAVVKDASGQTIKLRGANQDITERKRVESQVLEITDREQARIGQDLHDGLCQQLVSLAFDANSLCRKLSGQAGPETSTAVRIADLLDQAITESRRVSRGLFPIRLETEGLTSALEELARTIADRFQVQCHLENHQPVRVADLPTATHLYRIAQEAVSNAIKHGRPHAIVIRLQAASASLSLDIEDDGCGISPGVPDQFGGMGLHIMRYRARAIGATIRIEARPTGGTAVSCCVPCSAR